MTLFHFTGIKGSGMSSLAQILFDSGEQVQGSDVDTYYFTEQPLRDRNITILTFDENNRVVFRTANVVSELAQAKNTLTQRTTEYESEMSVKLDASGMKDGDVAGLSAFIGCYSYVAVEMESGKCYLVMRGKELSKAGEDVWKNEAPVEEFEKIELESPIIDLKVVVNYHDVDKSSFSYRLSEREDYIKIGIGRDAKDCMINRGIMHGGGLHTQKVTVQVREEK